MKEEEEEDGSNSEFASFASPDARRATTERRRALRGSYSATYQRRKEVIRNRPLTASKKSRSKIKSSGKGIDDDFRTRIADQRKRNAEAAEAAAHTQVFSRQQVVKTERRLDAAFQNTSNDSPRQGWRQKETLSASESAYAHSVSAVSQGRKKRDLGAVSPPPPPPPPQSLHPSFAQLESKSKSKSKSKYTRTKESEQPESTAQDAAMHKLVKMNKLLRDRLELFHAQNADNVRRAKGHIETLKKNLYIAVKALHKGTPESEFHLAAQKRMLKDVCAERDALVDEVLRLRNDAQDESRQRAMEDDACMNAAAANIAKQFCAQRNKNRNLFGYRAALARHALAAWKSQCARKRFARRWSQKLSLRRKRVAFRAWGCFHLVSLLGKHAQARRTSHIAKACFRALAENAWSAQRKRLNAFLASAFRDRRVAKRKAFVRWKLHAALLRARARRIDSIGKYLKRSRDRAATMKTFYRWRHALVLPSSKRRRRRPEDEAQAH